MYCDRKTPLCESTVYQNLTDGKLKAWRVPNKHRLGLICWSVKLACREKLGPSEGCVCTFCVSVSSSTEDVWAVYRSGDIFYLHSLHIFCFHEYFSALNWDRFCTKEIWKSLDWKDIKDKYRYHPSTHNPPPPTPPPAEKKQRKVIKYTEETKPNNTNSLSIPNYKSSWILTFRQRIIVIL